MLKATYRNRLLQCLSPRSLAAIEPYLERVELQARQTIHQSRTSMEAIYFIETALVSVSTRVAPTKWVEVWLIGSEGMTGVPVVLADDDNPPFRRTVQVAGHAYRISRSDLRNVIQHQQGVRSLLLKYAQVVLLQTSQSGACDSHHSLKERLSRWLLLARDGMERNEFPMTHQMLARLLGVRRASVTDCLNVLATEKMIENERGLIRIPDPAALHAVSCDCYNLIRREYDRLIGSHRDAPPPTDLFSDPHDTSPSR